MHFVQRVSFSELETIASVIVFSAHCFTSLEVLLQLRCSHLLLLLVVGRRMREHLLSDGDGDIGVGGPRQYLLFEYNFRVVVGILVGFLFLCL